MMAAAFQMRKPDHVDLALPTPPSLPTDGAASTAAAIAAAAVVLPVAPPGGQPVVSPEALSALQNPPPPPPRTFVYPEYEVYDASSISIKEASTSLQRSLAENGFSSHSVETAV
jgi:hypothetical protein